MPLYDVAIIGGGIAGLTAAILLGKKGFEVVVLEKNRAIGAHNKFQMQGFPAFEVPDLPLQIPRKYAVRKGHLWTPNKTTITFKFERPILHLHYRGTENSIDTFLADLALKKGVDIHTSSEVRKIQPGRLIEELITKGNKRYRTRCILAADGANSPTRRLVGANFLEPKGLGLGAVMDSLDVEPLEFHGAVSHQIAPKGYCYIIGHPDRRATVAVSVRPKHLKQNLAEYFTRTLQFFRPIIKGKSPTNPFFGVVTCGEGNQKLVHQKLLFIGEAGGFQDPLLGFGMAPSMKSAQLASSIIEKALTQTQEPKAFQDQLNRYDKLAKHNFFQQRDFKLRILLRKELFEHISDSQLNLLLQTLQGKEHQIEKALTRGLEHLWPTLITMIIQHPFLLRFFFKAIKSTIGSRTP